MKTPVLPFEKEVKFNEMKSLSGVDVEDRFEIFYKLSQEEAIEVFQAIKSVIDRDNFTKKCEDLWKKWKKKIST